MTTSPLPEPLDDARYVAVCRVWREAGLSSGTVDIYRRWVKRYLLYCHRRGFDDQGELTQSGVRCFVRSYFRGRSVDSVSSRANARSALFAWSSALECLGRSVPRWRSQELPKRPVCTLVKNFVAHRATHRGIAKATQIAEAGRAEDLLSWLKHHGIGVGDVRVQDIDQYTMSLCARLAPKTVAGICSSLRAFLRYLYGKEILATDLSVSVVLPVVRSADRPPQALPWEDVRRILGAIDRKTRIGRRDYALLLMMSLYGLGAGEVSGLQLEDVDWRGSKLRVARRKTGKEIIFPLLPVVAEALADFLQFGRPNHTSSRAVFVQMRAPYQAMDSSSLIRHRIVEYAKRAGVQASYLGSHVLRHSHATRQIEMGVPVKFISDILGHTRPETTSRYTRSAVTTLRRISLPVPS